MASRPASNPQAEAAAQASWIPMLIIALAQIQMAFNINSLQVLIGDIVGEFNTTPGSVSTALVVYSLAVAGFVMLGAKIGQLLGARLVFQASVLVLSGAMAGMALSAGPSGMVQYQGLAGLAAAVLVPTLVVLIATHYKGKQQAQALGYLGASQAAAGVLAFLISGALGTFLSWRYAFFLLVLLGILVFVLSFRLRPVERQPGVKIDWNGALLAAVSIALISLGFNYLNDWGVLLARSAAPFNVLGLSPAPIMIVAGVLLGQLFLVWTKLRQTARQPTLIAPEVLDSVEERAATYVLLVVGALGPAVNFLIPLYIQIVQGRTSLFTAVAVIPYSLAIFAGTAFIVRLFDRFAPRVIGAASFVVVATGLTMLAFTVSNSWGTPLVILSLIVLGLGEGALLTLVFNVLVSASPKELAGDVGALRGTANNLSTALGTAIIAALAVGILSALVTSSVANNPATPPALLSQLNLDNVNFISNEQLDEVLAGTTATPEQAAEAARINEETRLRALKACFLILAGMALLAIYPATRLPGYVPGEIPSDQQAPAVERRKRPAPAA
ncbi:MAG TPA: MFS transporter [Chloroflexaceae bacterium]|nr:MFS transporter [Chloroflexaceae bacterium]